MQATVEAQPAQPVRCPKCGRENEADAARCRVCWKPIPVDANSLPPAVRLTGIDVSIGELSLLLIKLAIAALPIAIVFGLIGGACNAITGGK